MPTYISMLRYTQQGIASVKSAPERMDAAKEAYRKAGGELKAIYLTLGQYDLVVVAEMPNDDAERHAFNNCKGIENASARKSAGRKRAARTLTRSKRKCAPSEMKSAI